MLVCCFPHALYSLAVLAVVRQSEKESLFERQTEGGWVGGREGETETAG